MYRLFFALMFGFMQICKGVLLLISAILLVLWLYRPGSKSAYDDVKNIPFKDED